MKLALFILAVVIALGFAAWWFMERFDSVWEVLLDE